jgi:hypothetical protein
LPPPTPSMPRSLPRSRSSVSPFCTVAGCEQLATGVTTCGRTLCQDHSIPKYHPCLLLPVCRVTAPTPPPANPRLRSAAGGHARTTTPSSGSLHKSSTRPSWLTRSLCGQRPPRRPSSSPASPST